MSRIPAFQYSKKYAHFGMGVFTFFEELYRQNKTRLDGYAEMMEANKIFNDTIEENRAYTNTYFLPYLQKHLTSNVISTVSPLHEDWGFSVSAMFQSGRLITVFTYPPNLLRNHFIACSFDDPEIFFDYDLEKPNHETLASLALFKKSDPKLLRHNMEKFIGAHEATHANELHNVGQMMLTTGITACNVFMVAAMSTAIIYHCNLLRAGLYFAALSATVANYAATLDQKGNPQLCHTVSFNPDKGMIQSIGLNAFTLYCERRADAGAIRTIMSHETKEDALAILEAASVFFDSTHFNTDDYYSNMMFPSHPSSSERKATVLEAMKKIKHHHQNPVTQRMPTSI